MVVVFGSINLDLVTRVERFPRPGETLAGSQFATYPGGKGANQALAAARAGAQVSLYGAVGRDAFADPALALLDAGGVDLGGVQRLDAPTGCATILVNADGENAIAVVAGANAVVQAGWVPDDALTGSTLLVLQQEIPLAANAELITRARRHGARILLNAAPAYFISLDLLREIDVLVVNEAEAATLADELGWPNAPDAFAAAASAEGALAVIVTLGGDGALAAAGDTLVRVSAPTVDAIDTTGAGDAFVGALAAALDAGYSVAGALPFAVAAGSHTCTRRGAQPALPDRAAIEALLPTVTLRSA